MSHRPHAMFAIALSAWSCAAALSLIVVPAIAEVPADRTSSMQVFACEHPLLVRIDGIPPVGEEEVAAEVRTCGLGLASRLALKEDNEPEFPIQIRHDPADFPYSTPFDLPYSLTVRDGKLDARLELRTSNDGPIIYEVTGLRLDAKHVRFMPVKAAQGPELALSISALNDGVDHVGINAVNTPVNQLLAELVRVKKLQVRNPEFVSSSLITFVTDTAVPVKEVMSLISDLSDVLVKPVGNKGYVFTKLSPRREDIQKLRNEATGFRRSNDTAKLKATLKEILTSAKSHRGDENDASVGDEFAEFSLLMMTDENTPATDPPYLGQIARIERELGPLAHPEYAEDLAEQERRKDQPDKRVSELALAIMEKYPTAKTLPESASLLADFERAAIYSENLDDAESWSGRLNARLSHAKQSTWDKDLLKRAFAQAGDTEQWLGNTLSLSDRYAPADIHYERALVYEEACFGAESRRTDDARNRVISNARSQGNTARVVEFENRQIALSTKRGNPVTDYYAYDLLDLVGIRAAQGDLAQVIPLWQRVIELRRRVRGERSAPVVAGFKVLETLYRQNEQWTDAAATEKIIAAMGSVESTDDAAAKLRHAVDQAMSNDRAPMLICHHGKELEKTTEASPLAEARHSEQCAEYAVNRDPAVADAYFEEAIRLRKATQGMEHPSTRRTANRAIDVAMKAGDRDGADRVRAMMANP